MLTSKRYIIDAKVAPVRVTWSETVVMDGDAGNFYVKLTPHVDWAVDQMNEGYNSNPYETRKRFVSKSWYEPSGKLSKQSLGTLGAMKRNEIAQQSKRIFKEVMAESMKDVEKKIRAQRNKSLGQRWNKKV